MAGASDFKFGAKLGFIKARHKITQKKGWVWPWARAASQNLGVPFQYLQMDEAIDFKCGTQLGFA